MKIRISNVLDIAPTGLDALGFDCLIDVRSPAEFALDHVPGAINLPVLDDDERARVGTTYVQDNPFNARKLGAALVAINAAKHLQGPLADKPGDWRPLVYCWRGGQRSGSFATILAQIGWRVGLIEGGYQSYRRLVAERMHADDLNQRVVLLDGNTGTAKTEMLAALAARGVQVLDLEGLAHHRGSVFGRQSMPQPSQKMFESRIAQALATFDPQRPVLIEAESAKIGRLNVPPALWHAMCAAPRVRLRAEVADRAAYLLQTYKDDYADPDILAPLLRKLEPIQGKERVAAWHQLAQDRDYLTLVRQLLVEHYDPRYRAMRKRHAIAKLADVDMGPLTEAAVQAAAEQIAGIVMAKPLTRV